MSDMEVIITIKNADANLPITEAAEDMRDHLLDIFQGQVEEPIKVIVKIVTEMPGVTKNTIRRCLYSIDEIREEKE